MLLGKDEKYHKIIDVICAYKGIDRVELSDILKDRECKYLLFLLLKRFKCTDYDKLYADFSIENKKTVNYNLKKAEEKFFINKEFRDMYFEAEDMIDDIG